ncbi:MAG TPA: nucleotidyltransferase domain-containing protein [Allocoleopsis sp.]
MNKYVVPAKIQHKQHKEKLKKRQQRGYEIAQEAANLLKTEYGAKQVILFGSILSIDCINSRSDIDLAVMGINSKDYFRALGRLKRLDADFTIDLVEIQEDKPQIYQNILQKGIVL